MDKADQAYKTIGEVAKILDLKINKKGTLPTHIIRFWETQFKQLKPKILNSNRRYYDEKNIDILKKIKYLLKDQGMTINGVKKILDNEDTLKLDEMADKSIKVGNLKNKSETGNMNTFGSRQIDRFICVFMVSFPQKY